MQGSSIKLAIPFALEEMYFFKASGESILLRLLQLTMR